MRTCSICVNAFFSFFSFFSSYNTLSLKYPFIFGDTAWAAFRSNWKICSLFLCSLQSRLCNQNCMVFQHSCGHPAASDTTITSPLKGLRSLLKLIYILTRKRSGLWDASPLQHCTPRAPPHRWMSDKAWDLLWEP